MLFFFALARDIRFCAIEEGYIGAARCRSGWLGPDDGDLKHTAHRPRPLPRDPWIMKQEWHDLLFAHWAVPVQVLRPLIRGRWNRYV
jgi:hypothetical protein